MMKPHDPPTCARPKKPRVQGRGGRERGEREWRTCEEVNFGSVVKYVVKYLPVVSHRQRVVCCDCH